MGIVGGTASALGGGKFSNGAMSGAFTHMFNAEAGHYAMKIAMGTTREGLKVKQKASEDVAMVTGVASAIAYSSKNPMHKVLGKALAVLSGAAAVNSHMIASDAGNFNPNLFAVEMLTIITHYPTTPLIDVVYDEVFVRGTDFLTTEPNK